MLNRIRSKLQSRGETITETLVALLISSLGLMLLAGAITSSTKIILNSKAYLQEYYKANEALEVAAKTDASKYSVSFSGSTIEVYGFENSKTAGDEKRRVVAYRLKE